MHQPQPGIHSLRQLAGLIAQHAEVAGAVVTLAAEVVGIPQAIGGGIHGEPETLLGDFQFLTALFQFRRARGHPLLEFSVQLLQGHFGRPALGDIAGHAENAGDLAGRILEQAGGHIGPDRAAILADAFKLAAEGFGLRARRDARDNPIQFRLGQGGGCRSMQLAKAEPDNLLRRIAA